MCLTPRRIDNPYLGLAHIGYNYLHDCTALKMEVPCGHCPQCIAMKQSYIVQRSQMESKENDLWFCTLTYKTSKLRYIDVNGYRLKYADIRDVQNMIKRMRKRNLFGLPFRFWAVVEYGGKKHRPHFHLIFSTPKIAGETQVQRMAREKEYYRLVLNEWRRNEATCIDKNGRVVANTRSPRYEKLCDYRVTYKNGKRRCTYDFHYIDPTVKDAKGKLHDESDVAFYVTKYTVKANKYVDNLKSALRLNLDPDEFTAVWSLLRPKCLVSKKWGNPDSEYVRKHIRSGIDRALSQPDSKFPYFINPSTGQTFPLAPFYKKRFFTLLDAHSFFYKQKDNYGTDDNFIVKETTDPIDLEQKMNRFTSMRRMINLREEEDPFYTYVKSEDYEKEITDSDYLLDYYLDAQSSFDSLFVPFDEHRTYGVYIDDYGLSEYGEDPTDEFRDNDFDN